MEFSWIYDFDIEAFNLAIAEFIKSKKQSHFETAFNNRLTDNQRYVSEESKL
ncbi:MAG: hypothetical protein AAF889_12255 [Cyanobacteria bacterium P01_D01_bin.73]